MKNNRRLIRVSGALLSATCFITNLRLPVLAADNLMGTEKKRNSIYYHRCLRHAGFGDCLRLAEKQRKDLQYFGSV